MDSRDTKIPLVDLRAQYKVLKRELDSAMQAVIDKTAFIGGNEVTAFESAFARYCGVKHSIGVGNGTDALFIALRSMGIGEGDAVATVPNTFIATAEAISMAGARPVFVDIEERTYTMDPDRLEGLLLRSARGGKQSVKAVIPVHLYGQPCRMDALLPIAEKYRLKVVEDAAQAHGAGWGNGEGGVARKAGALGHVGCFSFYPGKNLGAYGDGGAILTNDGRLAGNMRMFANHGRTEKYDHQFQGINSRLDTLQAAVLNVKLRYLDQWTAKRRKIASLYRQLLSKADVPVVLPHESPDSTHVYHLYVVRVPNRDAVRARLAEKGIATGIHYPIPLHLSRAYAHLGLHKGDFPVTEKAASEVLSLPMYPELELDKVEYIAESMIEILRCGSRVSPF
ncbi:MAG: DegT/DnrJ/EryC1/StrS family aminotransferase, partial [Deltaproteobacteria bacterium]|nr:DegT/DnrJ/EryC1/StrS family aminotransferase [Deltaproteobacteria bacterium]